MALVLSPGLKDLVLQLGRVQSSTDNRGVKLHSTALDGAIVPRQNLVVLLGGCVISLLTGGGGGITGP